MTGDRPVELARELDMLRRIHADLAVIPAVREANAAFIGWMRTTLAELAAIRAAA